MRHNCKKKRLGVSYNHSKSLSQNLSISLLKSGNGIKTSLVKAKIFRKKLESLITYAKRNEAKKLSTIRYLLPRLFNDIIMVTKVIDLAKKYHDRPGGYTRVVKCGYRNTDRAPMALVQFV